MVESHSLFAHILAQTRQNVELLMAHRQISEIEGEEILARLPTSVQRNSERSSVVALTQHLSVLPAPSTGSPAPPKTEARAIWEWSSEDPNDLSFKAGEIIEIVTETNVDWWTGRSRSGKQGLFPSNYVDKLPPRNLSPIVIPEPRNSTTPVNSKGGGVEQRYSSPALPHPSRLAPPQPYPAAAPQAQYPPPAGYYPPVGPPPNAVNYSYAPPPQQEAAKKHKLGGLGQLMAQSAAGGVGFGAGAAIGGGIINSVF